MIKQTIDHRLRFAAATVVYSLLLGVFYWKYVPLVAGYQMILAPILVFLTIWTAVDIRKGLLAFIFLFPLINNLPYFFKLYEPLPMAPSALILFLFFFWGWLLHRTFAVPDPARDGDKIDEPIFTPLKLFAGLVFVSALITFWRYTNFFPLWRPRIYELVTNAYGTSAGGAIMSVVFYSLTYLTGIAFFMILVRAVRTEGFVRKAIMALGVSTLISLAFGLFQHFKAPALGNNPTSVAAGLINATFKDALSFGAYLAMIFPLFFGLLFNRKARSRMIPALLILPAVFLLFFAGSKSAFLSLSFALVALGLFALAAVIKRHQLPAKKLIPIGLILLLLTTVSVYVLLSKKVSNEVFRKSPTLVRMENLGGMLKERTSKAWSVAWRMIKDYPLSGLGSGSFIIESSNYINYTKEMGKSYGNPESVENLSLQIGAELGVPGILIFFWILWKIIRRGFISYRRAPPSSFEKALIPAIGSGLLAFVLNAQVHSYIGSYEIHYAFWLISAMLFSVAVSHRPSEKPMAFTSRIFRYSTLALVIIYGASLLWISTHALSLNTQTRQIGFQQEFGLGPVEKDSDGRIFRWSDRFSGITHKIDGPILFVPLLVSHPNINFRPVRIKIFIATDLATKPILLREILLKESRWINIKLPVPEEIRGFAFLLFEVDRTWNPLKEGVSNDSRNLGMAIGDIKTSGIGF